MPGRISLRSRKGRLLKKINVHRKRFPAKTSDSKLYRYERYLPFTFRRPVQYAFVLKQPSAYPSRSCYRSHLHGWKGKVIPDTLPLTSAPLAYANRRWDVRMAPIIRRILLGKKSDVFYTTLKNAKYLAMFHGRQPNHQIFNRPYFYSQLFNYRPASFIKSLIAYVSQLEHFISFSELQKNILKSASSSDQSQENKKYQLSTELPSSHSSIWLRPV